MKILDFFNTNQLWGPSFIKAGHSKILSNWRYSFPVLIGFMIFAVIVMGYFSSVWGLYTFLGVFMLFVAAAVVVLERGHGFQLSLLFIICVGLSVAFFITGYYDTNPTQINLSFMHNAFH